MLCWAASLVWTALCWVASLLWATLKLPWRVLEAIFRWYERLDYELAANLRLFVFTLVLAAGVAMLVLHPPGWLADLMPAMPSVTVVPKPAQRLYNLERKVLVRVEVCHASGRLLLTDSLLDLRLVGLRVEPGIDEIGLPEGGEIREDTLIIPPEPSVAFERPDRDARPHNAGVAALHARGLLHTGPALREVEGKPLEDNRFLIAAQLFELALNIVNRHRRAPSPDRSAGATELHCTIADQRGADLAQRCDHPSAQAIALLGSHAHGDAGPFSDVDFLRLLTADAPEPPDNGTHPIDKRLVNVSSATLADTVG